jgi:hypothetical protein
VKTLQIILVLALVLTSTAAEKRKKPPDVQIVEASARLPFLVGRPGRLVSVLTSHRQAVDVGGGHR